MLHVVKLIQRHYPEASNRIVIRLLLISAAALALGAGLLVLQ